MVVFLSEVDSLNTHVESWFLTNVYTSLKTVLLKSSVDTLLRIPRNLFTSWDRKYVEHWPMIFQSYLILSGERMKELYST